MPGSPSTAEKARKARPIRAKNEGGLLEEEGVSLDVAMMCSMPDAETAPADGSAVRGICRADHATAVCRRVAATAGGDGV
ncbi:hypothetical protein GCM10028813_24340 [Ramlibacter alkalitolerans]